MEYDNKFETKENTIPWTKLIHKLFEIQHNYTQTSVKNSKNIQRLLTNTSPGPLYLF